jgi:hypothetical protein
MLVCVCTHVCMYIGMYGGVCMYVRMYVHSYVWWCVYVRTYVPCTCGFTYVWLLLVA